MQPLNNKQLTAYKRRVDRLEATGGIFSVPLRTLDVFTETLSSKYRQKAKGVLPFIWLSPTINHNGLKTQLFDSRILDKIGKLGKKSARVILKSYVRLGLLYRITDRFYLVNRPVLKKSAGKARINLSIDMLFIDAPMHVAAQRLNTLPEVFTSSIELICQNLKVTKRQFYAWSNIKGLSRQPIKFMLDKGYIKNRETESHYKKEAYTISIQSVFTLGGKASTLAPLNHLFGSGYTQCYRKYLRAREQAKEISSGLAYKVWSKIVPYHIYLNK